MGVVVMPCNHIGSGVIVCTPTTFNWRSFRHCPTCERRRWFLVCQAVWYPSLLTCLGCGDTWDAEYGRMERPFARNWRTDSIRRAKAAPYTTKTKAHEALMAEVDQYVSAA